MKSASFFAFVRCIVPFASAAFAAAAPVAVTGTMTYTQNFNPHLDGGGYLQSTAIQADGKILIGGDFATVDGMARRYLARLENGPATQSLVVSLPSRVTWQRGGTPPEVGQVAFELSTDDGNTWSLLGKGSHIPGGWELTGLNLPTEGQLRARGRCTSSGYYNGSSGIIEAVAAYAASPQELWRYAHFGVYENAGPAADNADTDKDGLENLVEFAFGRNPNTPDAAALPAWQLSDDDYTLTFTRPANVSGITYVAEHSTSLAPGSWTAVPNSGTPPNYAFFAPAVAPRLYLRVRVTMP